MEDELTIFYFKIYGLKMIDPDWEHKNNVWFKYHSDLLHMHLWKYRN